MQYEESPLWIEVDKIISSGSKDVTASWSGQFHSPTETRDIFRIMSRDLKENFETWFADEYMISVLIPFGMYAKFIYPNRSVLDITLTKEYLTEVGGNSQKNKNLLTQRFQAVPVFQNLPIVQGTDLDLVNEFTLDLRGVVEIKFQLIDKRIQKLHTVQVNAIYRNITNWNAVFLTMVSESDKIIIEGQKPILGVDVVEADNDKVREHVILPPIKLVDVPTYINRECGGIYNSGIGTYFKNNYWFVYPLFNVSRFNTDTRKKLYLYKVPSKKNLGSERTYREDGNCVYVIGTSDSAYTDDANTRLYEQGNGFRLGNPDSLMGDGIVVKDNKCFISRSANNSEVITQDFPTVPNSAPVADTGISSNVYLEYSKLLARGGAIYSFIWENSKSELLIPGMMTKIIYFDNDVMNELSGVLINVQTHSSLGSMGVMNTQHKQSSTLSVFISKASKT